jgi:hypothetical protein
MSEFFGSVKADLLDRRLLPLVVVVVLALAGAVAYVVIGGGSTAATPTSAVARTPVAASSGVSISQTTPEKAVAETSGGVSVQHHGRSRDPFAPIVGTKSTQSSSASTATTSSPTASKPSSSSSGSSESSGGSKPTSEPTKPSTPSKPAKPAIVYHVAVLFGLLSATGATAAQLTPYENVKLLTPLPTAKQPLIVFRGVTAGGKSATFTLVSEAILHGNAACLPSASQCEAIDLKAGDSEQLEYVTAEGALETYELKIVSIVSSKASSSAVKGILRSESKIGRELLSHAGLTALPDLRYSSQPGVLVFAGHQAFGAHARPAAAGEHGR